MINKIAVFTSGGDSPGMNACIRAVVLTAKHFNIDVLGYIKGYEGLIDNVYQKLLPENLKDSVHRGGTILKSARSQRFMEEKFRLQAAENLKKEDVQGIIAIGGDGTFKGALAFEAQCSLPVIGCAGTIDNDLVGTDFTIGYDTAINTVIEAIDKIRDTAQSHDRIFVVEVMGRDAGLIALRSAIGSGADALLIPELKSDMKELASKIEKWKKEGGSRIIIVSEGDESGGAFKVAEFIKTAWPLADVKVSVLGHIQRGGNPTCMERVNAGITGYHAVKALLDGKKSEMVGIVNKTVTYTPFEKAVKHHTKIKPELELLLSVLSA
ncbi:MAG: 6-phosphofructokinase [Bacteroidia bacterium]|jgi:6-phosphofructokinase 1|nr:6-phosphofructokinase [Bacteroidia bacterium]